MMIGEKIFSLRKARGWSQEELAEQIGVTRQALSRWEAGTSTPDAEKIIDICDLFGVSADYLLREHYSGQGEVLSAPATAPTDGKSFPAAQILGIVLIGISLLTVAALGIVSSLKPHIYVHNGMQYTGVLGYVKGHKLQWLLSSAVLGGFVGLIAFFLPLICKGITALAARFRRKTE